jgi:deoxyribodipyrimidine photolyase-related protein
LRDFGAYEDAMTTRDDFGFHSLLSIALNLSLLSPRECIEAAFAAYERGDVPINSVEGFVRQIIGWREFMYHMGELFPGDYQTTNNGRPSGANIFWPILRREHVSCWT